MRGLSQLERMNLEAAMRATQRPAPKPKPRPADPEPCSELSARVPFLVGRISRHTFPTYIRAQVARAEAEHTARARRAALEGPAPLSRLCYFHPDRPSVADVAPAGGMWLSCSVCAECLEASPVARARYLEMRAELEAEAAS
jgi:hypothetical protein